MKLVSGLVNQLINTFNKYVCSLSALGVIGFLMMGSGKVMAQSAPHADCPPVVTDQCVMPKSNKGQVQVKRGHKSPQKTLKGKVLRGKHSGQKNQKPRLKSHDSP